MRENWKFLLGATVFFIGHIGIEFWCTISAVKKRKEIQRVFGHDKRNNATQIAAEYRVKPNEKPERKLS